MVGSPTLVLLSGLPGTGKTTLADALSAELGWGVVAIDEVANLTRRRPAEPEEGYWDRSILRLLGMVEAALTRRRDVIVDHIFMNRDRLHAAAIARSMGATLRPIHTFVSDPVVWRERVDSRRLSSRHAGVASWRRISRQQTGFRAWEPGTALFVDGIEPFSTNLAASLSFVTDADVDLLPLDVAPFTPGRYH